MSARLVVPAATSATSLTLNTPAQTTPDSPITLTGTYQGSPIALDYDFGSGWVQATSVAFSNGTFSFTVPAGLAAGTYTPQIRDDITPSVSATAGPLAVSAWTPETLSSSPGAQAVFEFNPNNPAAIVTNASGDVTRVLNSVNSSEYLTVATGSDDDPVTIVNGSGQTGTSRLLQFDATKISSNSDDPATNWLDAGGVNGTAGAALVDLANSSDLETSGAFSTVIAIDINKSYSYEAGPIWGTLASPGPLQYVQLRLNEASGEAGANLAPASGTGTNAQSTITAGWHVMTMIKNGDQLTYRLDGKVVQSETISATAAFTASDFMIGGGFPQGSGANLGAENGVPAPYVGEFQAYSGVLQGSDLANAEKLAGNSVGLSLSPVVPAPAPTPTIAVSAPGSVQEASVGAGVTVSETVTTTGLSGSVYEEVLTSSGAVETGYQAVALGANGTASFSVHLAKSGDTIRVVNSTTSPTVTANSSPVTITDPTPAPTPTIAVSAPGSVQEASVGAGVTVSETVTTTGLSGSVYEEVLTSSGAVETGYQAVALGANGTASFSVHLAKSGDTIRVVNSTTSPTVTANSSPVTITDPTPAVLTAVLPSPLYTGVETVTGTGGVPGLQLERITQGSYNTPGQSGWVAATVAADGTWSVQLSFDKPGMLAHVYAENGGSKTVVDLVNGTPVSPPAATIAVSAPGSVQEASVGAGVTVSETVTTTGLSGSVYEEVLTSSGAVETGYQAVALGANGTASFSVHLAKSGDTIRVVNSTTSPTVTANSSPVTITDPTPAPTPTIAVSAPGSVQEASVGAGVTVSETVTTTGLSGSVYEEVLTSSGAVETGYQAVALGANGTASFSVHVAKSGDTIRVVNSTTSPTVTANSSPVTITDPTPAPTPTIAVSAPGSVQEASVGAGVTVSETVTTTGLSGSVYEEVLTSSGAVETGYQAVALGANGTASFSVHLAKSGDTIRVVNSTTSPTVTANSSPVTITDPTPAPTPTIAVSAPGSVQEASVGAGVTVSETVTTTGLSGSVYEEVLTSSGAVETGYQAVALGANGTASFSVHLAKSGDTIRVVNSTTSPTVTANSSPVTITDPTPAVLTAVLPSPLYTGVETVTGTGGVPGLQLERITQGSYNTPGQSGWVAATVAADGTWSVQLSFDKPGMLAHVYAENGGSKTVVDLVNGTPVSPPATGASTAYAAAAPTLSQAVARVSGSGGAATQDFAASTGGGGSSQAVLQPQSTSSGAAASVLNSLATNSANPILPTHQTQISVA